MKTSAKWLVLLCAVGVGFTVAACDEEAPMGVQEVTTPPTTDASPADEAAPTTTPLTEATPLFTTSPPATNGLSCMGDHAVGFVNGVNNPKALNCTSGDVQIALVQVGPSTPETCVEGEPVTVDMIAVLQINSNESRSDNGIWIATDGGEPEGSGPSGDPTGAETGICDYWALDRGEVYSNPFVADGDGDDCGGMPTGSQGNTYNINLGEITIVCKDSDNNGSLDAGGCLGWKVPGQNETCPDDAYPGGATGDLLDFVKGTLPGTRAKCRCELLDIPVQVVREATVTVIKDLNPPEDPGKFDLSIRDYEDIQVKLADDVGDTGQTSHTFTWNQGDEGTTNFASVLEAAGTPNAGLQFYNTSYSCVETFNQVASPITGTGVGPVNLTLANKDNWVCTYVNDRIPVPTVTVTKDATPTYTRDWDWTITKKLYYTADDVEIPTAPDPASTLGAGPPIAMPGMVWDLYYLLTVNPTPTDTDFKVAGTITVTVAGSLPPYVGNFTVTDDVGGTSATVDCDPTSGVSNQKTVTAAGSFTCDYSATLATKTDGTNTATASVTWNSYPSDNDTQTGTAGYAFGDPTTEEDETVHVCDPQPLTGTAVATDPCETDSSDYLFSRTRVAGDPFRYEGDTPPCNEPGDFRDNTARLTEVDTDTDRTANHRFNWVCQRPPPGCTLTQGYWKTHSEYGPAPYDDNWANLPNGADTQLDSSSDTWYEAFHTPPKGGNAWYQLAHQWMAATLNVINEASTTPEVDAALTRGYELLDQYGPQKKIPKRSDDAAEAKDLARLLTQYNEGTIGPGHCDDDHWPDSYFTN